MFKKGDFHIHSKFSDGQFFPKEIILLAKERSVDIISLTDHNTTNGINEAIKFGIEFGVKVIPGVELSTRYNYSRVHILGYFKDDSYNNELLISCLKLVKNHKISLLTKLLNNVLYSNSSKNNLDPDNGIKLLKFFGATTVLAHPILINKKDLPKVLEFDFDGIEAKYFFNTPNDTKYFLEIAQNKNLIYTAGSDFHKINCSNKSHGVIGDVYLNEKEIYNFLTLGNLYNFENISK